MCVLSAEEKKIKDEKESVLYKKTRDTLTFLAEFLILLVSLEV